MGDKIRDRVSMDLPGQTQLPVDTHTFWQSPLELLEMTWELRRGKNSFKGKGQE